MDDQFLSRYMNAFDSIPGWFSAGSTVPVSVNVTNLSRMPLTRGDSLFGLSCHVFSADQFDIVWEGVTWLKDRGNPTAHVQLAAMAS